jgi:hypothetical protein
MRSRRIVIVTGALSVATFVACGGQVDFVTGSSGSGAEGGGRSTSASTSSNGGKPCLADVATGGGAFKTTKCFEWDSPKPCPETAVASPDIDVDSCMYLESVDDKCTAPEAGECCYNVTETPYCK